MNTITSADNSEQVAYWNAVAGLTWARLQRELDQQIDPLGRAALTRLDPRVGEWILDVGCGCGQTSLELAERVGERGRVVAVDISRPMLEVARARPSDARSAPLEFREVDAQTGALGMECFDAAFSRFGVMFFTDPRAAFANIRRALKPNGRIAFVCWRALAENAWMRVPLEAARALLPPIAPADPTAPGPFAFADPQRVHGILESAGFADVSIEPLDLDIGGTPLDAAVNLACRLGPLGSQLREQPQCLPAVADAVKNALGAHLRDGEVWMGAAVWVVGANVGGARGDAPQPAAGRDS
ncbi:MAG: class I SAM-dependent methyltransferase [Gammaproteobacteria bacterium]|nr:class I SAM-dependent methyltransferase [Gammaproteobacteria bacterium]